MAVADAKATISLDSSTLSRDMAAVTTEMRQRVQALERELKLRLAVMVDDDKLSAFFTELKTKVDGADSSVMIDARLDDDSVTAGLQQLQLKLEGVDEANIRVDLVGAGGVESGLDGLASKVQGMPDADIDVDVDRAAAAHEQLDALAAKAQAMPDADIDVDVDRTGAGAAGLAGFTGALGGVGMAVGGAAAAVGALGGAIAGFGLSAAADLETVNIAFAGILGSDVAGSQFVTELQQFAATTPFAFNEVSGAAQKLIGSFGVGFRDEVTGFLSDVGGVAAALGVSGESVDKVTTALLQMKGKGKASAEEIQQISESLPGFNSYAAIAEARGTSVAQVMKDMAAGTITADEAITAIREGMREFPGAATAMADQAGTLSGVMSTLKDNLNIKLGTAFTDLAQGGKTALADLATSISSGPISLAIEGIAGSFGGILPAAQPFLDSLATGLSTAFSGLTTGLGSVMEGLAPLLAPLGSILGSVFETVGGVIGALLPVFQPMLGFLAELATALGPTLVEAANSIAEAMAPIAEEVFGSLGEVIPPLATAFAALVSALLPLLPPLVEMGTAALPAIVPLITLFANGITLLAGALGPVVGLIGGVMGAITGAAEGLAGFVGGIASAGASVLSLGTTLSGKVSPELLKVGTDSMAAGTGLTEMTERFAKMETAAKEANALKLTAMTTEVKSLASPAELARNALDALATAVKDLGNEKLDMTQARAEVEKFLDEMNVAKDEVGRIDFNVDTAAGRKNFETLTGAAKKFAEEAVATAKATGSTETAIGSYALRLGQLKQQFVDAGGNADEFDRTLTDMGLDPYDLKIVVDDAGVKTLQTELDKLKSAPETQVYLKTLLDAGESAKVSRALDLIKTTQEDDPIAFKTFVEESSRLGAERALENLAAARGVDLDATANVDAADADLAAVASKVRTAVFGTEAPTGPATSAQLDSIARAVRMATIGTEAPNVPTTGAQIDAMARATRLAIIGTDSPNAPATGAQLDGIARATRTAIFGTDSPTATATSAQLDGIARAARTAVFGTDAPNKNATKAELDAISNFIRTAAYGTTADTAMTKAQLDAVSNATRTAAYGTTANTATANDELNAVARGLRFAAITAAADTGLAEFAIAYTARERTAYINVVPRGGTIGSNGFQALGGIWSGGVQTFAAGGIHGGDLRFFRNGGMDLANNHMPEIAPPVSSWGQVRVWGEPETKGESYIPHANDYRRPRSVEITRQTAALFGYDLVPAGQGLDVDRLVTGVTQAVLVGVGSVINQQLLAAGVGIGVAEGLKSSLPSSRALSASIRDAVRREIGGTL